MWEFLIPAAASLVGGHLSRQTAKRERKDHFVNLRNSAQRAGFNPLSVLRATMGGGYEQYAGILSRNPIEGALVAGANAYTSGVRDKQIRAHEINLQQLRQKHDMRLTRMNNEAAFERQSRQFEQEFDMAYTNFEIQDRLNELQLTREIALENARDPYRHAGENILVWVGNLPTELKTDVAKRHNIKPNDNITAGELAEMLGEVWGEGQAAIATKIGANVLGRTNFTFGPR